MNARKRVNVEWRIFASAAPGKRFVALNRRFRERAPPFLRPLLLAIATLSFAVGVVLVVLPGPAIVFFAGALACGAAESTTFARLLDRAEGALRRAPDTSPPPKDGPADGTPVA